MRPTSNWTGTWSRFRPHAEALVDLGTGRRWTWSVLHYETLCWAGRLRRLGVGPGDRVAVLALNRGETLALLFACAELGAVLVPLNWRLAVAELRAQLAIAAPRAVFADARHAGILGGESLEDGPGNDAVEGPGAALESPWVLLFTSGSTGKPKAAQLTHGQLHWNALNTILACDLQPSDTTLTFTPLFHTGGLNCLTTPLLHRGGRVVVTPGFDVGEALRVIARERVSLLMAVPTMFQMLADHPDFAETDLSSVRDALCGGAALPLPLLRRYLARGFPLRQGFGMTEVGPNCFSLPPADAERKSGSVGLPIHHIAARLARPDGTECGVDEPGELLLSGPSVFGGYWQNPEATAASIRDGWFHTGDVLHRDSEGYFYVSGRIKEMFISGGENVFPAEVEAALIELPGVAEAVVLGVPDPRWGEVGVAWVRPMEGAVLAAATLKEALVGRLARFKQPRSIHLVDQLPRTASGKVDKPLLRSLETP